MPILSTDEAVVRVGRVRADGGRIVFTNGVFDLLHPGHLRYLQQSRELGDALVVGVNSDRSVRAIKGESRPVTPEHERAEILAALSCVDVVVLFDEDTPFALIARLQPDVLVKGADWAGRRHDSAATSSKRAAAASSACRSKPATRRPASSRRSRSSSR